MRTKREGADRAVTPIDSPKAPWLATLGLGAALLLLALWALPRAVQAGDAGEFATVMLSGGVPHPSGYPWMRILGLAARFFAALGIPKAAAAALPPSLAGVAAWMVAHRLVLNLPLPLNLPPKDPTSPPEVSPLLAWTSAGVIALVASAPVVVLHVNDSEVWGPHLLFSALFLRAALRPRPPSQRARWRHPFSLGLWLGLAVSHHLTAILLVPLAVGAAWPRRREGQSLAQAFAALLGAGGLGLAGSGVGLAPLLTLPIGVGGGWRWGDVRSVSGFLHHVLRRDYGTFSLSLHEEEVAGADTVGRSLSNLSEVFTAGSTSAPAVFALLCLGLAAFIAARALDRPDSPTATTPTTPAKDVPTTHGPALWGWLGTLAAATLAFPAAQNIDPGSPFGAWILERFDLLPALAWALALAWAAAWVGRALALRLNLDQQGRTLGLARLGGCALLTVLLLAQFGALLERGRPATEAGIEVAAIDLVESPDPAGPALPSGPATAETTRAPVRAIVFGTDDHRSFPVLYVQEVLGAGQHTLYIDAQLLAHPWYRARLRERLPALPDVDKPLRLIGAIWSDPQLDAVPIYLANVFSAPAQRLARVPEGLLWRVVPPADHPRTVAADWQPSAVAERHLAALARCRAKPQDFAGLDHPRGHPWSADAWNSYVDPSRALIDMLVRAGDPASAEALIPRIVDAVDEHAGVDLLDD